MGTYITYSASDIGNVRSENQDTIGVAVNMHPDLRAAIGIVCDGVGGLEDGKYASEVTYKRLLDWFQFEFPQIAQEKDFEEENFVKVLQNRWLKLIENLNRHLYEYAQRKECKLGTTLTVLLLYMDEYFTLQVGDSRAYQISHSVKQLTEDQSLVAEKVRKGIITKEQAKYEPKQNVLLQSIGYAKHVEPDFKYGSMEKNVSYLICSDGFYHYIEEEELAQELAQVSDSHKAKEVVDEMIGSVKNRGETDNISVAYIKYERNKG